jgi:hypothetical protein
MSTLTRTRRLTSTYANSSAAAPAPPAARSDAEAPERAVREHEAPESRRERCAEAPDAGAGRTHACDHEFTHGRSQS